MNGLRSLILSENFLNSFDNRVFFSQRDLEYLDLSNNSLTSVDGLFMSQARLRTLLLGHNKLASITALNFLHVTKLEHLDLSFNNLYFLPNDLFSSQEHLETLLLNVNKLTAVSVSLLIPLRSVAWLDLLENPLVCDCELRLTMLWCEEKAVGTKATCRNQLSGNVFGWTVLKYVNYCPEYEVPDVFSTSDTKLTTPDDVLVPDTPSQLCILVAVICMVLLLILCCVLLVLYYKKRSGKAASRGEKSEHVDTRSNQNYQNDYISSSHIYNLPEIPPRPTQTNYYEKPDLLQVNTSLYYDNLDHVQAGALTNGVGLVESDLCGTDESCHYYDEPYHNVESGGNKSHDGVTMNETHRCPEREHKTISEIPLRRKSDGAPETENLSKATLSSYETTKSTNDSEAMVDNCLYLEGGAT
jgi:hypothetical protein